MNEPPRESTDKKRVVPGWNDPPMLNYSVTNPPPKSRIANKRVAFPISSPAGTTCSPNISNAPPANISEGPPKND